jgi:hypothetical protein
MRLSSQLAQLVAAGLVQPELSADGDASRADLYTFRHILVRDAAYSSLLKAHRRDLHSAAAEALEAMFAQQPRPDNLPAVLGYHFAEAGEAERAVPYLQQAGDAARQRYANAEAIAFYERALALAGDDLAAASPIYTQLARVLEMSGRHADAIQTYTSMHTAAQQQASVAGQAEALVRQATVYATPAAKFDPLRAKDLAEQALALAQPAGLVAVEARARWALAIMYLYTGQPNEAVQHGEAALALARRAGDRELEAFVLHDLYMAYSGSDRAAQPEFVLEQTQNLWRELGNLPLLAESLTRASVYYAVIGDFDTAIAQSEQAWECAQASRNLDSQVISRAFAAMPLLERGDWDRARSLMESAITLGGPAHNPVALSGTQALLAGLLIELGEYAAARDRLHQAISIARSHYPLMLPWPLSALARLNLAEGDVDAAEAALAGVDHYAVLKRQMSFAVDMWIDRAQLAIELALARRDHGRALAAANELLGDLRRHGLRAYLPAALRRRAQALLGSEAPDRAQAWRDLSEACTLAEQMGARRSLWPALADLAVLERQRGRHAQAAVLLARARDMAAYIADHAGSGELRRSFLATPAVRRLWQ